MPLWAIGKKTALTAGLLAMLLGSPVSAGEQHWVYGELPDYKQLLLPEIKRTADNGYVTEMQWKSVHSTVLNDANLDKPVQVEHWAALLKLALELPADQMSQMIDMYVSAFNDGGHVSRENAVGGLVKLLTIKYISGTTLGSELEPSKALKDLQEISEKQRGLVQKAYIEGILDASVSDRFRPKDKLTNAEAVSMAYRIMMRYRVSEQAHASLDRHWVRAELSQLQDYMTKAPAHAKIVNGIVDRKLIFLDRAIPVGDWHQLLMAAFQLPNGKVTDANVRVYTTGLLPGAGDADGIPRDKAVAGMMKVLGLTGRFESRDATADEEAAAAKAYTDYSEAWDTRKLAQAYASGYVQGYEDGRFRPNQALTYAEAFALLARAAGK